MKVKKVLLMSPREPSGATWLINCFLELGIKTYRQQGDGRSMWLLDSDHCKLRPEEEILKKWLPALWDHSKFFFRSDVEVEWAHFWPKPEHDHFQVIYFTRDPRDSIFSRFKREAPPCDFESFLAFPDVNTLLDKAHNWRLFSHAWMQHPRCSVFRFEDYKSDASRLLKKILGGMGLPYSDDEIERAVVASTFGRAAEAEQRYRALHPGDSQLINRAGKAGEWQNGLISEPALRYIETVCADMMVLQGYRVEANQRQYDYSKVVAALPFLQQIKVPDVALDAQSDEMVFDKAKAFATPMALRRALESAALPWYEVEQLLTSFETFAQVAGISPKPDYRSLRSDHGLNVGFVARRRAGIRRRVKRILGALFPGGGARESEI